MSKMLRRLRSRRAMPARRDRVQILFAAGSSVLILLAGLIVVAGAFVYLDALQQWDSVRRIPDLFDESGYRAPAVYDREGEVVLFSFHHPATADRTWLEAGTLSARQLKAVSTLIDPSLRAGGRFDGTQLVRWISGSQRPGSGLSVSQRVVLFGLPPSRQPSVGNMIESLQVALLAERLVREFGEEKVLDWFLNGAYFGNGAYGFDAASLLYFGEHAEALSLAKLALLCRIAQDPDLNPFSTPNIARLRQAEAMELLHAAGIVSGQAVEDVRDTPAEFRSDRQVGRFPAGLEWYGTEIYDQFISQMGSQALRTGGLRITSSIDVELQIQTECLLQEHLRRLNGRSGPATDLEIASPDCPAADLLPPLRPGEVGVDHAIGATAAILMEPVSGQVLAMTSTGDGTPAPGSVESGEVFYPFLYLAAFAEGGSPGSMVLDVSEDLETDPGAGPLRSRTALVTGSPYAALRTLQEVGLESVRTISQQMGLETLEWLESPAERPGVWTRTSILNLAEAFSVLANDGRRMSVEDVLGRQSPLFVLAVTDGRGRTISETTGHVRAVLSRELAYMINDALRDEGSRRSAFGGNDPFQIGRPVAAQAGASVNGASFLTVGYTPDLLAVLWVGGEGGSAPVGLSRGSAAAPAWRALMRYGSNGEPVTDWQLPPGLTRVEVCDPSGLLPSESCPSIVTELFQAGGEPIVPDNLYRSVKINQETGRLATVETPIDQVAERVYLIPPEGAKMWAERVSLASPPEEYDEISERISGSGDVRIEEPGIFEVVSKEVTLRGSVHPEDLEFFRLQFGRGLNPDRWIQVGEDQAHSIWSGILDRWDTGDLSGLYTLQLLAVESDSTVHSAAIPVTVDNQPPAVSVTYPLPLQRLEDSGPQRFLIEISARDQVGIASVSVYLDGLLVRRLTEPPYLAEFRLPARGQHILWAVAEDLAGNTAKSDPVAFTIEASHVEQE